MKRIPFLEKAIRTAKNQIDESSSLPDAEWESIIDDIENEEINEYEALREKAQRILTDAEIEFLV